MRDDQGPDALAHVRPDVEDRDALRSAQPLVGVAGPPGGGEPAQIDLDHARRVRSVDQRVDPAPVELPDDGLDREHEGGGRGDVADEREPGSLADRLEVRLHHLGRVLDRERHPHDSQRRAIPLRRRTHGVEGGVVLVVAREQLIAGLEPDRRQHRRHGRRRVGHEHDPLRIGVEEPGDLEPDLVQPRLELAVQEPDGLRLQPLAPHALRLQHGRRARTERAVVEERDVGFEEPRAAIVGGERHLATIADRRAGGDAADQPRTIDPPARATTVGSNAPRGTTWTRPRPATFHVSPGRPMTQRLLVDPQPGQAGAVLDDLAPGGDPIWREVGDDRHVRQEAEAVDPAARGPYPSAERHRAGTGTREAGAASDGGQDRRPRRRVAEHGRDEVRVAAREGARGGRARAARSAPGPRRRHG